MVWLRNFGRKKNLLVKRLHREGERGLGQPHRRLPLSVDSCPPPPQVLAAWSPSAAANSSNGTANASPRPALWAGSVKNRSEFDLNAPPFNTVSCPGLRKQTIVLYSLIPNPCQCRPTSSCVRPRHPCSPRIALCFISHPVQRYPSQCATQSKGILPRITGNATNATNATNGTAAGGYTQGRVPPSLGPTPLIGWYGDILLWGRGCFMGGWYVGGRASVFAVVPPGV